MGDEECRTCPVLPHTPFWILSCSENAPPPPTPTITTTRTKKEKTKQNIKRKKGRNGKIGYTLEDLIRVTLEVDFRAPV